MCVCVRFVCVFYVGSCCVCLCGVCGCVVCLWFVCSVCILCVWCVWVCVVCVWCVCVCLCLIVSDLQTKKEVAKYRVGLLSHRKRLTI